MSELIAFATPVFLALLLLERWAARVWPATARRGYARRDTWTSLSLGLANVAVSAVMKGAIVGLFYLAWRHRLFDIGSQWWAWVLLFVAEDFCYYWFHRVHHEVRLFWAAHVNHHSSRHFNLSTALRQSWTTPITGPIFWAPLALIGFHPVMIITQEAVSLIYQFWLHTEFVKRLGPLEWVFNTPSHHRVHHGRNVEYLDRNYGGILIVWDRLFGTFEPERKPVDYGLTKNLDTFDPVRVGFHEWIDMARDVMRAPGWRDRLSHVFRPPGWSPDGRSLTARQLQARAVSHAWPGGARSGVD